MNTHKQSGIVAALVAGCLVAAPALTATANRPSPEPPARAPLGVCPVVDVVPVEVIVIEPCTLIRSLNRNLGVRPAGGYGRVIPSPT